MPWSYRIDNKLKTVFSNGTGVATDDDIRGHSEALQNDPEFDRTYNQLIDLSGVTNFELSLATIQAVAWNRIFGETSRRAIVAPQDVAFGSARVFQAHNAPDTVMVFRDMDKARRWLDLN